MDYLLKFNVFSLFSYLTIYRVSFKEPHYTVSVLLIIVSLAPSTVPTHSRCSKNINCITDD